MRRSAVAAVAAVGDSLPPALLFPFKSKRFKEGFRGGFGVSRNFTSSFLVPSSNLGFRRQEQQQQESRKGPTFIASSFRKSLLMYHYCQANPEPEQTTATSVDQDASTGGLPATVLVEESGAGNLKAAEPFLRLPSPAPWANGLVISTMVIYWGGFHMPLGLGGLAIVANLFPQHVSDPQFQAMSPVIQAMSRVSLQLMELAGTAWLIKSTLQSFKPQFELFNVSFSKAFQDRGWIPASALGLLVVLLIVIASASITQYLSPSQVEEAPSALTGLVTSTPVAWSATYLAFCVITPVIEEYVYRGFLLASLASHIRWPFAIIVSSLVFAISHLGASGLPSLFMIGCVLGLAYTWTGNLATSLVIHGLYNAIVLTRSVVF